MDSNIFDLIKEANDIFIMHSCFCRSSSDCQDYPQDFIITDKVNCVVCMGKYYHTSLDCDSLKWELKNSDLKLKGMDVKEAKKQGMIYCADCSSDLYHFKKGDLQK